MTAPHPLLADLVARRRALRLTQTAAAGRLGVARAWLNRLENGRGPTPRADLLSAYADLVGVTFQTDCWPVVDGDEVDRLVARAAHLVERGRGLMDDGIALRRQALEAMPVGTVLRWESGPHRAPTGDVTKTLAGWAWVGNADGDPARDDWVSDEWARGNLHRATTTSERAAS